jgi:NAD(P)H-dependent FMN reductase
MSMVMTMIVGIVGSPRKDGLTSRLVDTALEGAASGDVEIRKVYLGDYAVAPYAGVRESCPEALNRLCEDADALVLGSPVYWGDVSGVTKSFMETVRIANADGKAALGISIAGGTGKGLLSAIQSLYHFFFHKRMRAIDPTPVSRFNLDAATAGLRTSGRALARLSRSRQPFHDLSDVTRYYQSLPFLNCDILDEFMVLVAQLLTASQSNRVDEAAASHKRARALIDAGDRVGAAAHAVTAYETLYYKAT